MSIAPTPDQVGSEFWRWHERADLASAYVLCCLILLDPEYMESEPQKGGVMGEQRSGVFQTRVGLGCYKEREMLDLLIYWWEKGRKKRSILNLLVRLWSWLGKWALNRQISAQSGTKTRELRGGYRVWYGGWNYYDSFRVLGCGALKRVC